GEEGKIVSINGNRARVQFKGYTDDVDVRHLRPKKGTAKVSEDQDEEYTSFEDWADALVAKYGPEVDYEPDAGDDRATRAIFNGRLVGVFHADASDDMVGTGTVMAGSSTAAPLDEAKWEP